MKSAHSKILVGEASGVRAPYAVRSPLRAGPKWKFESITFREVAVILTPAASGESSSRKIRRLRAARRLLKCDDAGVEPSSYAASPEPPGRCREPIASVAN